MLCVKHLDWVVLPAHLQQCMASFKSFKHSYLKEELGRLQGHGREHDVHILLEFDDDSGTGGVGLQHAPHSVLMESKHSFQYNYYLIRHPIHLHSLQNINIQQDIIYTETHCPHTHFNNKCLIWHSIHSHTQHTKHLPSIFFPEDVVVGFFTFIHQDQIFK